MACRLFGTKPLSEPMPLIGPVGTNFSEIRIKIQQFSCKSINLRMSSAKRQPSSLGLNVLTLLRLIMNICVSGLHRHLWRQWLVASPCSAYRQFIESVLTHYLVGAKPLPEPTISTLFEAAWWLNTWYKQLTMGRLIIHDKSPKMIIRRENLSRWAITKICSRIVYTENEVILESIYSVKNCVIYNAIPLDTVKLTLAPSPILFTLP